jgi:hypothetical protein
MNQIKYRSIGGGCRCVVRPAVTGFGDVKTIYGSRRRPTPRAGLIVETPLALEIGALVELELIFDDQPFTYRSRGFVSWVFQGGDAAARQLGVTITSMDKVDELGVSVSARTAHPVVESILPPSEAPAAAPPEEPVVADETREAIQDVFDVLSMLLPDGAAGGGVDDLLIPSRDGLPEPYAAIVATPGARIDLSVHVPGHGQGRFCYLTTGGAQGGTTGAPLTLAAAEEMFGKLTGQRVNVTDAAGALAAADLAALSGVKGPDSELSAVIGIDEELASVLCSSMRQIDSPAHFPTAPVRFDPTGLIGGPDEPTPEAPEAPAPPVAAIPMVRISHVPAVPAAPAEPQRSIEERLMAAFQRIEGLYGILDQDDAAAFIVQLARDLIPCQAGACALLVDGAAELHVAAASGVAADERRGERIPAPRGFLGFAIRSAQVAAVTEPARIYPQIDQISRMHVTSVLAAPVAAGERVLGAVELLNAPGADGFSVEDGDLLAYLCQSLGEHIAQSLESHADL